MSNIPAILLAWNPFFLPATIREHVEILKQCYENGAQDPYVYWGKIIKSGTDAQQAHLKQMWRRISRYLDSNSEGELNKYLLGFVTDFSSIHAIRITGAISEDALRQATDQSRVPGYYKEHIKQRGFWLKIDDIRVVSHDPVETNKYLMDKLGFDPYRSDRQMLPDWIDSVDASELFDDREPLSKLGLSAFAQLEETVFPVGVKSAMQLLQSSENLAETWKRLEHDYNSRLFLAYGWMHSQHLQYLHEKGTAKNPECSGAIIQYTRALERVLCTGIIEAIQGPSRETSLMAEAIHSYLKNSRLSLGKAIGILEDQGFQKAAMGSCFNRRITDVYQNLTWLKRLRTIRNAAAHPPKQIKHSSLLEIEEYLIGDRSPQCFGKLVELMVALQIASD